MSDALKSNVLNQILSTIARATPGLRSDAMDDAVNRARDVFDINDSGEVIVKADAILPSGTTPATFFDFDLRLDRAFYFAAPTPAAETKNPQWGGLTKAEVEALTPEQKLRLADEISAPKTYKSASVETYGLGAVAAHAGLSVEEFNKLSPVRKLELENQLKMTKAGY